MISKYTPLPTPSLHHSTLHHVFYIGGSGQINASSGIQYIEPEQRITESARLEQSFEGHLEQTFPYCSWLETIGISSHFYVPSAIKHFYDIYFLIIVLIVLYLYICEAHESWKFSLPLQSFLLQSPSQPDSLCP